jgi:hypothetical protein
MTQITAHGRSCTGAEAKSFPSKFHDDRNGGWKFQVSGVSTSDLERVVKCPVPSGTHVRSTFGVWYGLSDEIQSVSLHKLETY